MIYNITDTNKDTNHDTNTFTKDTKWAQDCKHNWPKLSPRANFLSEYKGQLLDYESPHIKNGPQDLVFKFSIFSYFYGLPKPMLSQLIVLWTIQIRFQK